MTNTKYEQKKGRASSSPKKNEQRPGKRFISFHPTKEEKEYLRNQEETLEDVLSGLEPKIVQGHKVSIGYSEASNAFYASIREGTIDWREAKALSAWHKDAAMALRALCFGVGARYPTWPDTVDEADEFDLEW